MGSDIHQRDHQHEERSLERPHVQRFLVLGVANEVFGNSRSVRCDTNKPYPLVLR